MPDTTDKKEKEKVEDVKEDKKAPGKLVRDMSTKELSDLVHSKLSPQVQHKFIEGNFGPISVDEEKENILCEKITGEIPSYFLGGEYVRTGPNPALDELIRKNKWSYHWFDGDGVVHGLYFSEQGKAYYSSKYVESDTLKHEIKTHNQTPSVTNIISLSKKAFMKDAFKGMVGGMVYKIQNQGTGNTAMVFHDQRLLALSEAGLPYHISAPYLETVGTFNYEGRHVGDTHTAHPKIDRHTGELIFYGALKDKPAVNYFVVSGDGSKHHFFQFKIRKPQMMHDFAITKNYSVILDQPFFVAPANLFSKLPVILFDVKVEMKIGLVPRYVKSEDEIKWFTAKNGYIFHTANAWEVEEEIEVIGGGKKTVKKVILIACRSERLDMSFYNREPSCVPKIYQYTLNLEDGSCEEKVLSQGTNSFEFPNVNPNFLAEKSRYIYSSRLSETSPMPHLDSVFKFDLLTGEEKQAPFGDTHTFGGEAVFVPDPDGKEEDDGSLVLFTHNEEKNQSYLQIFNAKDMTSTATIEIPSRVPYGFHGTFVTKKEVENQRNPSPSFKKEA